MITLPGLIDVHVHLREPGWEQKEDFETGTKAAIAGGYTTVLDMPNNPQPIITLQALENKIKLAGGRIYCDLGFHFGGAAEAIPHFDEVKNKVFALKVYMNHTTGPLLVEDQKDLENIFSSWPKEKHIMVHAEGETLISAIGLAKKFGTKLHVCHVSLEMQVKAIRQAKSEGMQITAEAACHHLFLTEEDVKRLGNFGMMRPPLSSKEDQASLWQGLQDGTIDIIASDHAPHTKKDKEKEVNGVPGLETSLPLLLTAMAEGKITEEKLIELTSTNPRKIFNIPEQPDTFVKVDPDIRYTIYDKRLYTKCGWTPFEGMKVTGKIQRVILRGQTVYKDGEVLNPPQGQIIYPAS